MFAYWTPTRCSAAILKDTVTSYCPQTWVPTGEPRLCMQVEVKSVDMIKSSIHSTLSQISKLGQFSVISYLIMEHNCIWSNMTAISALPSEDCHWSRGFGLREQKLRIVFESLGQSSFPSGEGRVWRCLLLSAIASTLNQP
jgi:hypothetical protein